MVIPKIETSIWLALKAAVGGMVTSPVGMAIYEPGQTVNPPPSDITGLLPFITVTDARNDNVRPGVNSSIANIRSGTLMISIQWPLTNPIDHEQLTQMAAVIADQFPEDRCMRYGQANLRVTIDADVIPPYTAGAYRVVVTRVLWTTV